MATKPLKSIKFPGLPDTYTIPQADPTLTQSGQAADAKKTGDEITDLKSGFSDLDERVADLEEGGTGSGLTEAVKVALLQIAQKVAYTDAHGQDYYDDLYDALYPPATLVRIDAIYTQSGTVLTTDTLDSLKDDLVVTATYTDQTTEAVTNYTLSGTLSEGISTITVSYGGKTATFNVNVTERAPEPVVYKLSDGTLSPMVPGSINTVNGRACIRAWVTNRKVINVTEGLVPFVIMQTSTDTPVDSGYYPIPVPQTAKHAEISVTPSTLTVNGTIRKYENGAFTMITDAKTKVGSIEFDFTAGDSLYFVGLVEGTDTTDISDVSVTFV